VTVKFLSLAIKGLKERSRDRRSVIFLLLFPIVLMVIFAFVFGSANSLGTGTAPHQIAVVNLDQGATVTVNNVTQHIDYGASFTQLLENITYPGTNTHMFALNNVSADQAQNMLKRGDLDALITIPENFSQALVSSANDSARAAALSDIGLRVLNESAAQTAASGQLPLTSAATSELPANTTLPTQSNVNAEVILEGNTGNVGFEAAQELISNVVEQYESQVQVAATSRADATLGQNNSSASVYQHVSAAVQPLTGTQSLTLFDYQASGIIVFALLMQVGSVAQDLARESDRGTLRRLKVSNMRSFDLLFGTLLTWIVIAVAQVLLLFGVAVALGFVWAGGANSIALAVLFGIIGGIASISLGLLLTSFTTNERQAAQLGVLISIPVAFLSGAFLPLPTEILGTAFGTTFEVYDLLPWTLVNDVLREILLYGSGLADVAVYAGLAIVLTAALFIVGVITYSRVRLRPE